MIFFQKGCATETVVRAPAASGSPSVRGSVDRPLAFFSIPSFIFSLFVATVTTVSAAPITPNDSLFSHQWYLQQIHAPDAWSVTTGTSRVIVAVIDGGVDIEHPDLRENIWKNTSEIPGDGIDNDRDGYVDDVHGWNFVTNSSDVRPLYKVHQADEAWSHGTIVSSLIAAKGNDEQGMAGVAWNAQIMPVVVLDADGGGEVRKVVEAMRYAVNHGASIINLSLVGSEDDRDLQEMIRRAGQAGVLVVAATGNTEDDKAGQDLDTTPLYPVCDDGDRNDVLGVSGTDTLDQKAPYANFGKRCTDIAAPAQQLFAARPTYGHVRRHGDAPAGYIDSITGTSLATPLVAGVAALIKSVRPDWTPAQIIQHVRATATPIESTLHAQEVGKMGGGRVDAGRALLALAQPEVASAIRQVAHPPDPERLAHALRPLLQTSWVAHTLLLFKQLLL